MARANKKPQLIEFKGMTLPVLSVTLHSLQTEALTLAATELFGDEAFFDGDAAVLELDLIAPPQADENLNWASLLALFTKHGLRIIGVRGGSEALRESAASAGLPSFAPFKRPSRNAEESAPATTIEGETEADGIPVLLQDSPPPVVQQAPAPATLLIDRPLRSGQQAYARGGDLVVLAASMLVPKSSPMAASTFMPLYAVAPWRAPAATARRASLPPVLKPSWFPLRVFTGHSRTASRTNWRDYRFRSSSPIRMAKQVIASASRL